jgi:hypothetical protein
VGRVNRQVKSRLQEKRVIDISLALAFFLQRLSGIFIKLPFIGTSEYANAKIAKYEEK